jgi:CRP-like cAMP-binding protein
MARFRPPDPLDNLLLARLEPLDFQRLAPHLEFVPLSFGQPIYELGGAIDYAYFPTHGVISAVVSMEYGSTIEVATIGNEGVTGIPALIEPESSPSRLYVQVAGGAVRISADLFRQQMHREGPLRRLLQLYESAFMFQILQSLACNGLHTIAQRCCRWLLTTHDRMQGDELPLTHDLLAIMLGVRRASVSVALNDLQKRGCLLYRRGRIEVQDRKMLESGACECYRAVTAQYEQLLGAEGVPKRRREHLRPA